MAEKSKSHRPASRRDFLKATAAAAAVSVVGTGGCRSKTGKSPKPKQIKPPPERRTGDVTVVLVRDEKATDEKEKINAKVINKMLEQARWKILCSADIHAAVYFHRVNANYFSLEPVGKLAGNGAFAACGLTSNDMELDCVQEPLRLLRRWATSL